MGSGSERHGLERIASQLGEPNIVTKLGADLTPSDLTTLMLAVAERRAARVDPAGVLRRYSSDRFSRPAPVPCSSSRCPTTAMYGTFISSPSRMR